MSDLGDRGKRALDAMKAQRNAETQRRVAAERKYKDLLAVIARAVVLELRAAKYIEIHEQLPDAQPFTKETP
ncbi:hypothetical protein [Cryobacterium arcticum]|uniref:Uncharacterized protein n=1 Tax=Cryobacterium arcticum TaxID=670052 RepID=A0A317ZX34_9MICO|nr:hypothetical protein [Cryobacterium arcticum]PXA71869.1 hypothetical protein CTB96_02810 [Cryobacterium arcticum]